MILKKVKNVLFYFFMIFLIFLILIFLISTYQIQIRKKEYSTILGYSLFIISSGSMEPTLDVGDDVIIKKTSNINKGDIIVYKDDVLNMLVCHRVVEVKNNKIKCQGDNNNSVDRDINSSQVIGKVIMVIPKIGYIQTYIRKPKIIVVLVGILILLLTISNLDFS